MNKQNNDSVENSEPLTDESVTESPESLEEEKKPISLRARIADFFKSYGGALIAFAALLFVAAIVLLAVFMGGTVYDKAAFFWILAFLAELGFYLFVRKTRGTLITMIITAALAVAFIIFYGLELGGILP